MEELNLGMVEPLHGKVGLFRELEEPLHGTARPPAPFAGRIRFPGRLKTAPERGEPVAFDPESSTERRTGTAPTACAPRSSRPRTASEMRFTKDRDDRDSRDSRDPKAGSACFFMSLESLSSLRSLYFLGKHTIKQPSKLRSSMDTHPESAVSSETFRTRSTSGVGRCWGRGTPARTRRMRCLMKRTAILATLILALVASRGAAAEDFPPITDEERALTAVPGEPNAPAVVLFKKGEFLMAGYGRLVGSLASHLRVQARVKILTEAGKSNGEVAVVHGGSLRLQNFSGRTVLPDGRVLPIPADAKLSRRTSKSSKTYVTTVVFPAVQAGAILDYQYEVTFDSPFVLEPWYFSEELPVRHAEVVYKMARGWTHKIWTRSPLGVKLEQEKRDTPSGSELRAWAENLPAVVEAPYGPPWADLATQILLLPETFSYMGKRTVMMGDWAGTTRLVNQVYNQARNRDWGVRGQAHKAAGDGSPRQKTEALYRFVRDEIQTRPDDGVLVDENAALQDVLSTRRGTPVEKALLLQLMLLETGGKTYLVWAADRDRGTVDFTLPNPNWFDAVLVLVELDGKRVLLDPSAPGLGFGQLRAGYEGTQALIFDTVQQVTLSETPFDRNLRRGGIDLSLGDDGRLTGHGTLRLTGLRAVERLHWKDDPAQTLQAWEEWL